MLGTERVKYNFNRKVSNSIQFKNNIFIKLMVRSAV
jgi:hypothetical protein